MFLTLASGWKPDLSCALTQIYAFFQRNIINVIQEKKSSHLYFCKRKNHVILIKPYEAYTILYMRKLKTKKMKILFLILNEKVSLN